MSAKILVIEDDAELRAEIVEFLTRRQHIPFGCGTLAEATAVLETMTPDSVLSDINLPDGDGLNFCMNNAPRFPAAMWLLMSGNDDLVRLSSKLKSLGGDRPTFAIVKKPVPLRLLDRFIGGIGAEGAAKPSTPGAPLAAGPECEKYRHPSSLAPSIGREGHGKERDIRAIS